MLGKGRQDAETKQGMPEHVCLARSWGKEEKKQTCLIAVGVSRGFSIMRTGALAPSFLSSAGKRMLEHFSKPNGNMCRDQFLL